MLQKTCNGAFFAGVIMGLLVGVFLETMLVVRTLVLRLADKSAEVEKLKDQVDELRQKEGKDAP
jgi:uncharacterized membrane-anchored protein YhcB (DUF1043 family)